MLLALLACASPDRGDLSPLGRWVQAEEEAGRSPTMRGFLGVEPPPFQPPERIRVWRRSLGGSSSCSGVVELLDLEDYVGHVVPHEWYASWEGEALMAGAIAVRSYSAWWVNGGGKYACADVDDTSATQNYGEGTHPRSDAAAQATAGVFAVRDGELLFAEYSAENGAPTAHGVSEPHCAGEAVHGHGRGLCQWGSQRWALDGKDHAWMIAHYYPGATLWGPADEGG